MRTHDQTPGERARDSSDASDSRRFVIDRDEPEPYGFAFHAAIGFVIVVLLIVILVARS
jgi:hypothetical protein